VQDSKARRAVLKNKKENEFETRKAKILSQLDLNAEEDQASKLGK
jgi:hypothetical protein